MRVSIYSCSHQSKGQMCLASHKQRQILCEFRPILLVNYIYVYVHIHMCMCVHEHAYLCVCACVCWRQGLLSMLCGAGCLALGFWESPIPASDDGHCHILLCMGSEDRNSSPCICAGSTFPTETSFGPLCHLTVA